MKKNESNKKKIRSSEKERLATDKRAKVFTS